MRIQKARHFRFSAEVCIPDFRVSGFRVQLQMTDPTAEKSSAVDPPEFCCPISLQLMEDPVLASDGHAYEREMIEQWFANGNSSSPVTGQVLSKFISLATLPQAQFLRLEAADAQFQSAFAHRRACVEAAIRYFVGLVERKQLQRRGKQRGLVQNSGRN